ncbi:hypothetical protein BH23ACT5_BH23ACT5_14190 [soil metagenome]
MAGAEYTDPIAVTEDRRLIPAGSPSFVDDGGVFQADIQWLAATGVTRGCHPPTNDRFCPNDRVTREQMAAFLFRALAG